MSAELQAREEALATASEQLATTATELESLRHDQGELRQERDQLAADRQAHDKANQEQRKHIQLLEIDVKSLKGEWEQALADLARAKQALERSQSRVELLETENAKFDQKAVQRLIAERDQLTSQLKSVRQDLTNRQGLLQDAYDRLDQLQGIISQNEDEQQQLTEKLADHRGQIDRLHAEVESSESNVARLSQEQTASAETLAAREQTIERFELEIATLRSSLEQLQDDRDQLNRQLAAQEAELASLCGRINRSLLGQCRTPNAVPAGRREPSRFRAQISRTCPRTGATLHTSWSQVEQERLQLAERLATQESQCSDLSAELEALRTNDSQLGAEHEQYAQCIATQVDQIERLTSELETARGNVSLVEQERDHLAQRLVSCENRIEQLGNDLQKSQADLTISQEQVLELRDLWQQALAAAAVTPEPAPALPASKVELAIEAPHEADLAAELQPSSLAEIPVDDTAPIAETLSAPEVEDSLVVEKPENFQPQSFIEQYSHLLDDSEAVGEVDAAVLPSPQLESHPATEELSDDGDLEAYMSNLMRRVRGDFSIEATSPPPAEIKAEPIQRQLVEQQTRQADSESEAPANPLSMEELAELRAGKSTRAIDLSAMREVANSSARSAIAKHHKRRHFEGALGKLLVTGLAGSSAGYMMASADHYTHPLFLGGCGVGMVSLYFGFTLLRGLAEFIRDGGSSHAPASTSKWSEALEATTPESN